MAQLPGTSPVVANDASPVTPNPKSNTPAGAIIDPVTGQPVFEQSNDSSNANRDQDVVSLPHPLPAPKGDPSGIQFDQAGLFFAWSRYLNASGNQGPNNAARPPYNGLKIDPQQPLDLNLSEQGGPLKVGTVVLFGARRGTANHAAMLIGYDTSGHSVWASDAIQRDVTVNGATRNAARTGDYVLLDPPPSFNGQAAANFMRQATQERLDTSGHYLGSKPAHEFTEYCQRYVRLAVEAVTGHALEHAQTANSAVGSYLRAGYRLHGGSLADATPTSHGSTIPHRAAAAPHNA